MRRTHCRDDASSSLTYDSRICGQPHAEWAQLSGLHEYRRVSGLKPHARGSTAMIRETAQMLEQLGMTEGSNANPGQFVIERAFVD